MTPAARGTISENYYKTLDGYEEDTGAGGSSGGPSEAPNMRSPHKPRHRGARDRQMKARVVGILVDGTKEDNAMRNRGGIKVGTSGNIGETREDTGQTSTRRGRTPKRK